MKYLSLLLIALFSHSLLGQTQDCELDFEIQNDSVQIKRFKEHLIYEMDMGKKTESLFFSLLQAEQVPLLEMQYLLKSPDFIPVNCLDTRSLISIQLLNGTVVSLRHANQDACSSFVYDAPAKNNIRILTSYFRLTDTDIAKLKQSPVSMIQIRFATEQKTFNVKNQLYSQVVNQQYHPATYLKDFLICF